MNDLEIKANIVTALYEHGLSPTLESVIDRLGYTDLYDVEFSEEGIVSYVVDAWKKMQHETMIDANKRLAGLHDLEEEILRDIAQAEKEGPNTTIRLPVGRWGTFFASLSNAMDEVGDQRNGHVRSNADRQRDRRESLRDARNGSIAVREASKDKPHPRDRDKFIKKIQGMSMRELRAFVQREVAQGEKTIKYLQTQLRSNQNLTPAEIKHIRKALRKIHVPVH